MQEMQREGEVAKRIERVTARIPSDVFLWGSVASIATALGFMFARKRQAANFIGQWVPTLLLLGLYNKLVKIAGHDRFSQETH